MPYTKTSQGQVLIWVAQPELLLLEERVQEALEDDWLNEILQVHLEGEGAGPQSRPNDWMEILTHILFFEV